MCSLGFHSLRIFPHWEWSEARGYIITLTFYIDNLSQQLHRHPIGCSVGGTVVNHMLYAETLFCLHPLLRVCKSLKIHTYGCNHDIEFNPSNLVSCTLTPEKLVMRKVWQSVGKCWTLLPLSHILDIYYLPIIELAMWRVCMYHMC